MPTFLLIGPSGAGKTTACKIVKQKSDIMVVDLDTFLKTKTGVSSLSAHLTQIGDEQFFELSKQAIEEIENSASSDTIIAVGAGSINLPGSHSWYRTKSLLALTGDPEIIYKRGERQKHHPTLNSFINTEFNDARKSLYRHAATLIDSTHKSSDEVANEIIKRIKSHS